MLFVILSEEMMGAVSTDDVTMTDAVVAPRTGRPRPRHAAPSRRGGPLPGRPWVSDTVEYRAGRGHRSAAQRV